jgi:hypothetical protein
MRSNLVGVVGAVTTDHTDAAPLQVTKAIELAKPLSFAELLTNACRASAAPRATVGDKPCPLARLLYVRTARSTSLAISLAEQR